MKRLFFSITFIAIIIGVVGVGLQFMFGYDTITYISRERINDIWIYKYDFWSYLDNIKQSLTAPIMDIKIPTRSWNNDIINNLAYILDILILGVNFLSLPIKIGATLVRLILSVVGINTISMQNDNPLYWLINVINTVSTMNIRYV